MTYPISLAHECVNDQLRLDPDNSDDGELLYDCPGDFDQMTQRVIDQLNQDGFTWSETYVTLRDENSLPLAVALFKSIADAYGNDDQRESTAEAYQLQGDDDFDYNGGIPWLICEAIAAIVLPIDPPNDEA